MKKPLIFLAVTLFLSTSLAIASRLSISFSEWYATGIYQFIIGVFKRIFGIFPFSFAEITLMILIPGLIAGITVLFIKLVKSKGKRLRLLLKTLVYSLCAASSLLLLFVLNCGINYNRQPFLYGEGIETSSYSEEELWAVFNSVLDEFNEIVPLIQTDEDGYFTLTGDLSKTAPQAMRKAGEVYPTLDTYYPSPKSVINSELMSKALIMGIYSPITGEANYNKNVPDSRQPFTACHELAHLSGYMKEDEANFIAFVACRESGEPEMMYSAYLYVIYQLYGQLTEYSSDAYQLIPEQAKKDNAYSNSYWQGYFYTVKESVDKETGEVVQVFAPSTIAEASNEINDGYLKANGQEEGVNSYGKMIDLVIATYLEG